MQWLELAVILIGLGLLAGVLLWLNGGAWATRRAAALAPQPDLKMLTRLSAETAWIEWYAKLPKEEQLLRRDEFVESMKRTSELLATDGLSKLPDGGRAPQGIPSVFGVGPVSETEKIRLEMRELRRTGADERELARLDQRMKQAFDRESQELSRRIADFEKDAAPREPYRLPKRLRMPTVVVLAIILAGAVLELTIGRGFIFAGANEYRSAMPWIFVVLLPVFAFLLFVVNRANRSYQQDRFPTWWVRTMVVFPLTVVLCSGVVLFAPLGWAALFGIALGTSTDTLEGRVLNVGRISTSSKGCRQTAEIEARGASADICVEGRLSEPVLKEGDTVLLSGRTSPLGVYIESIRAK